jgi:hypothetical protein
LAAIIRRKFGNGFGNAFNGCQEEGRGEKEEEFLALSGKVRGPAHPTYRLITNG